MEKESIIKHWYKPSLFKYSPILTSQFDTVLLQRNKLLFNSFQSLTTFWENYSSLKPIKIFVYTTSENVHT